MFNNISFSKSMCHRKDHHWMKRKKHQTIIRHHFFIDHETLKKFGLAEKLISV